MVLSVFGSFLVQYTANLSILAQNGMVVANSYSPQLMCLDSLGEITFGTLTTIQLAYHYTQNLNHYFWLALMAPYAY